MAAVQDSQQKMWGAVERMSKDYKSSSRGIPVSEEEIELIAMTIDLAKGGPVLDVNTLIFSKTTIGDSGSYIWSLFYSTNFRGRGDQCEGFHNIQTAIQGAECGWRNEWFWWAFSTFNDGIVQGLHADG